MKMKVKHIDKLMKYEASQSCASNEIDQLETMESDPCIVSIKLVVSSTPFNLL